MANDIADSRRAAVDAFLAKNRQAIAAEGGRGRLVIGIDGTASRQPAWDLACKLQGEMFQEVAMIGGLDAQLMYYRGYSECVASKWVSDARTLAAAMEKINCMPGRTQIRRVLDHARKENVRHKVAALVFIGDCVEEEPAELYAVARELRVPMFIFQEGDDPIATKVFRELARLTGGAHCQFAPGSTQQLRELLRAVARFASGGLKALADSSSFGAVKLLEQLKRK